MFVVLFVGLGSGGVFLCCCFLLCSCLFGCLVATVVVKCCVFVLLSVVGSFLRSCVLCLMCCFCVCLFVVDCLFLCVYCLFVCVCLFAASFFWFPRVCCDCPLVYVCDVVGLVCLAVVV